MLIFKEKCFQPTFCKLWPIAKNLAHFNAVNAFQIHGNFKFCHCYRKGKGLHAVLRVPGLYDFKLLFLKSVNTISQALMYRFYEDVCTLLQDIFTSH